MQKIHHRTLLPLSLMATLLVSGCQAAPSPAQVQASEVAAQDHVSGLTPRAAAESFYEALVAEILVHEGDAGSSYELMLRAAQTRQQEDLFKRAMQTAYMMGDGNRALRAAKAWNEALPQSRDANKAVLQVLVGLNQIPQSQWHLRQELRFATDEEMEENLYAIPLVYQRAPDKAVVLQVVKAALVDQLAEQSVWRGDALAVLGRIELQKGDQAAALELLRQAYAANAQASGAAFLALELYARGETQAGALLHTYAVSEKANPQFLVSYARLLVAQQHEDQALKVLERVTAAHQDMADPWLALAAVHVNKGQFADARAALDVFDRLVDGLNNPELQMRGADESLVLRAQMADNEGHSDQAQSLLEQVSEPTLLMRVQVQRAQTKAQLGQLDEARALIRSIPAPSEEVERLKQRAEVQLLRDAGQTQDALALLGQLIKKDPDDDDLVYEYALMAERLGNVKEMEAQLRRIIARSPGHFHALNALGYSYADRGVRLAEARKLIQKALSFEPKNPYVLDSMGWLEFRSGNLEEARTTLEQAYEIDPDAEIAAHLGEVMWAQGEHEQARGIWRQGLRNNAKSETLRMTIERLDGKASVLLHSSPALVDPVPKQQGTAP
ncbi:tetratricopeptide repeat protein [Lampropedia puyangensis]|uniref:Tetratricopeptide repeat protein n=1 Tax=Lampropedia puyangensis TaxID=1330072 RepID=A0A4S8EY76_9BURK|nr:tetratricopeptide repeat protein [Lampropedia puyangensis]THT99899.1 tetratricopeptide repeat protein [Lampropedia puyangensis]